MHVLGSVPERRVAQRGCPREAAQHVACNGTRRRGDYENGHLANDPQHADTVKVLAAVLLGNFRGADKRLAGCPKGKLTDHDRLPEVMRAQIFEEDLP